MSECQQLHPDPADSEEEGAEEEAGMYDDAEEEGDAGANGDQAEQMDAD